MGRKNEYWVSEMHHSVQRRVGRSRQNTRVQRRDASVCPSAKGTHRSAATGAADQAGVVLRGHHGGVGLGAVRAAKGVTVEQVKGGGLLVLDLLQAATGSVVLLLKDGQAIVLD